ncbi:hypothetical protein A2Z67_05905 [Candidatus Woesebacteria bacterium RBG_13_36_22]|uniref:Uncharacterized protein n=1 Tax=Candidatus Woesebacteria bacterium RBG_13_36_22 TaxID=1802478 RepID=A0A1F7X2L0_9BACT|nr:MAG: hypothetical protein A2Z67_05905 [Candidatus Woesebacteria bacterium RBG_13_36_22]
MDTLITKYPEFEKQIRDIFSFQGSLNAFRKISIPNKPTGNKRSDVPIQFSHFLNVIHIRLQSQINYLVQGLQNQNPEAFSTARNCLETIAALIFVYYKVKERVESDEYDQAQRVLYKASFGSRTEHPKFATSKEVTDMAKRAYNVLDYIDKANELVSKDLKKRFGEEEARQNYFRSHYDLLCELTHPNYLALSMYWGVEDDKFKYNLPKNTLTKENFGLLIHTISPFLAIYVLYLKRAQEFEKKMSQQEDRK